VDVDDVLFALPTIVRSAIVFGAGTKSDGVTRYVCKMFEEVRLFRPRLTGNVVGY